VDFLGLRNLTIIDDAVGQIELNHGKNIDLPALPLDDKPT
jgi:DNA polymerase III subunit alpha